MIPLTPANATLNPQALSPIFMSENLSSPSPFAKPPLLKEIVGYEQPWLILLVEGAEDEVRGTVEDSRGAVTKIAFPKPNIMRAEFGIQVSPAGAFHAINSFKKIGYLIHPEEKS